MQRKVMDPFDLEETLEVTEDDDQLSLEEDPNADVQALLQADLEVSPLVVPTPPTLQNQFVASLPGAPPLPTSSKEPMQLSPKKRKAEEAREEDFRQLHAPSQTAIVDLQMESEKASNLQKSVGGLDVKPVASSDEHVSKKMKVEADVTHPNGSSAAETSNGTEQSANGSRSASHGEIVHDQPSSVATGTSVIAQQKEEALFMNKSEGTVSKKEVNGGTHTSMPSASVTMTPEKMKAMRKQDILAIVTGTRSSISQKPDEAKSEAVEPAVKSGPAASAGTNKPGSDSKKQPLRKDRKRAPKPLRRILNARKETELAVTFMENLTDLLDYLPEKDCKFLADSLWIFTKSQLHAILDHSVLNGENITELSERAENIRSDLRDKLAEHFYFERKPEEKKLFDAQRREVERALMEECKTGTIIPVRVAQSKPKVPETQGINDKKEAIRSAEMKPPQSVENSETKIFDQKVSSEDTSSVVPESNQQSLTGATSSIEGECPKTVSEKEVKSEESPDASSSNPFNMPEPGAGKIVVSADQRPEMPGWRENKDIITGAEAVLEKRSSAALSPKEEEDMVRADAKLKEWLNLLQRPPSRSSAAESRFPVDGPISVLFPSSTRCFLATVKLMSPFKFLCTRRTETGALCEMLRIFRAKCGLPYLNHLALARHLVGLSTRLETALGSPLPLDDKARRWMGGTLIVCTGAALEFVVHRLRMNAAWQFLGSKTKALSIELATWREEKGLPSLKGSGKVAMISAWKAMLREENDAATGAGKILSDVDLEKEASKETPIIHDEKDTAEIAIKDAPTNQLKATSVSVDYASHSPIFVEHCLGKDTASFLATLHIATASQLEEIKLEEDSLIVKRMQERQFADSFEACVKQIDKWRQTLHDKLQTMSKLPPKSATKQKERKPAGHQDRKPAVKKGSVPNFSDPFEALSIVTRKFLNSIDITTGEQFLSQRTTDIAEKFVAFRIENGMPELKGLGAIASVSGWKAQCRKAATEMGLLELAATEPDSNARGSGIRRRQTQYDEGLSDSEDEVVAPGPPRRLKIQPLLPLTDIPDDEVLAGKSRVGISVLRCQGPPGRFDFELSVRKKSKESESRYFITYKGSAWHPFKIHKQVEKIEVLQPGLMPLKLPILSVASLAQSTSSDNGHHDYRQTFSSIAPGCGLIDLTCCGVLPPRVQNLERLKLLIGDFIRRRQSSSMRPEDPEADGVNVLILRRVAAIQVLLLIKSPVEKGQTIPLKFPTVATLLSSERLKNLCIDLSKAEDVDYHRKLLIDDALGLLSEQDLHEILKWTHTEFLNESNSLKEEAWKQGGDTRRRLHWLSRRVLSLIRCPLDTDKDIGDALFYRPRLLNSIIKHDDLDFETKRDISVICDEILASLENHPLCGSRVRGSWFKLASERFPVFLESLIAILFSEDGRSEDELLQKTKSVIEAFTAIEKSNFASLQLSKTDSDSDKERDAVPVIACNDPTSSSTKITFKPLDEIKDNDQDIAVSWYRRILSGITFGVLKTLLDLFDDGEKSDSSFTTIIKQSIESCSLEESNDVLIPEEFTGVRYRILLSHEVQNTQEESSSESIPASYQFFLGIVWPALREQRWRIEAGESTKEVTFSPPKIGKLKRPSSTKNEGNKKRQRLAREVDKLGWGVVGKLTQRIVLLATKSHDINDDRSFTVENALEQARAWIEKELAPEDTSSREKAILFINSTRDCYNTLAPFMANGLGWQALEMSADKCSFKYGSETLLQLLLVLPSVLRQMNLPLQQISDSFQIIREFIDVFTVACNKVLPKHMQPEPEVYVDEVYPEVSSLAGRLKLMPSTDDVGNPETVSTENPIELTEIILPSDKLTPDGEPLLTDFVVRTMEQIIPVRATDEDTERKYRRVHVGHPGMTCRHCLGANGEGRYFFSSIESLSTASNILEKHLMRCPKVPDEVKSSIAEAKLRHSLQRKGIPTGEQQAFFNRLWDRLQMGIIGGDAANIPFSRMRKDEESPEDDSDSVMLEFRDHLEVLDFVRKTAPWKNIRSIQTALNKYYSCLDYGGRIYQTPSMPNHFSSEWLLAKVVPKRYEYLKAKYLTD